MSLEEAQACLLEAIPMRPTQPIIADRDDPSMDRSAMDGVALRVSDGLNPRQLLGALCAGDDPRSFFVDEGQCVQVMTGACIPHGADAVVPLEGLQRSPEGVVPLEIPTKGQNIRFQGEQARHGDVLIEAGRPLNAARLALRAQVGMTLPSMDRIAVGVLSTGDELRKRPHPWQIRDSNGPMLTSMVQNLGGEARRLPPLPDERGILRQFLYRLHLPVLLSSGGVSAGQRDLLGSVLEELGGEILFHGIRLKPGKPMLAARLGDMIVLGLPGNPVSAYLNALLFLPLVLARLERRTLPDPWRKGEMSEDFPNPGDRPLLHPCKREGWRLSPLESHGSADLVSLAKADACAWIPEGGAKAGDVKYLDLI